MKFILPIISIIIFFWIIIATCIGFTSVHIWKLGYFISFTCSSILIDWNEISNLLLPISIQQYDIINKSKQLLTTIDRIILKGKKQKCHDFPLILFYSIYLLIVSSSLSISISHFC